MIVKDNVITADEGKVLRRISDRQEFDKELHLGYTRYLYGELLDEPLYELPEHYEEVDEPIESISGDDIEDAVFKLLNDVDDEPTV